MRTAKIFLPVAVTMLLAGGSLFANNAAAAGPAGGPHGDVPPCPRMADCPQMPDCPGMKGMQMSPEQRDKVQQLYTESNQRIQPLRDQLFVKNQELKALQNSTNPDVNAVSKKAEEVVALKKQIRAERAALGQQLDTALGLKPGTHSFMGNDIGGDRGHGPHHR